MLKRSISDRILLTWLAYSVASGIVFLIATSVIMFVTIGCWPMGGYQPGGGCAARVNSVLYLGWLPALFGGIVGAVLTYREQRNSHPQK